MKKLLFALLAACSFASFAADTMESLRIYNESGKTISFLLRSPISITNLYQVLDDQKNGTITCSKPYNGKYVNIKLTIGKTKRYKLKVPVTTDEMHLRPDGVYDKNGAKLIYSSKKSMSR